MATIKFTATVIASAIVVTVLASASDLGQQFSICAAKYADPNITANVMLECTAADGKLTGCKLIDGPSPLNGFDKAAICVAEVLPIGNRTGNVKVPVKFSPR